jgi:hypothetical protein
MSLPRYREALILALATNIFANKSYVLGAICDWWIALKDWEKEETFDRALSEGRMSVRTIKYETVHKPLSMVRSVEPEKGKQELGGISDTGITGLLKRMDPSNFVSPSGQSSKYDLGLHDMSASLLHPDRKIEHQLYGYGFQTDSHAVTQASSTYVVFMPLPAPEDHSLFIVMNQIAKEERRRTPEIYEKVRAIRAELTRVKFADADDSHIGFVEVSTKLNPEKYKYRYGIRQSDVETVAGQYSGDLARRRNAARKYTSILETAFERSLRTCNPADAKKVKFYNEIIVAYRKHASALFPLFARWNADLKPPRFQVVMSTGTAMEDLKGWTISSTGTLTMS